MSTTPPTHPIAAVTSARDRVERCLERIDRLNGRLGAMITVLADSARQAADACDVATARGDWLGPLHSMVVCVKDNTDVAGVTTTHGSDFFRDNVAEEDAEVVRRLRLAGAIVMGKTNLHELSFGATNQNQFFGPCRNPWDLNRIPGGSSGGSAVAVAAGMCDAALGTDTGGSVRVPASATGLVGLRPTFGRVSNRGVTATSPNFCAVGAIARRASEVARIHAVVAGHDPLDPQSRHDLPPSRDWAALHLGVAGLTIGIPRDFYFERIDVEVERAVDAAIDVLEQQGATVREIKIPGAAEAGGWLTKLIVPDAASRHRARLETQPDRFSEGVRDRLLSGLQMTATDYSEAMQWKSAWTRRIETVFEGVDIVATPTLPVTPPLISEAHRAHGDLTSRTYGWSMAGVPCLNLPCGFDAHHLPVGLQLAAARDDELTLFRAAYVYQVATDWHLQEPPIPSVTP